MCCACQCVQVSTPQASKSNNDMSVCLSVSPFIGLSIYLFIHIRLPPKVITREEKEGKGREGGRGGGKGGGEGGGGREGGREGGGGREGRGGREKGGGRETFCHTCSCLQVLGSCTLSHGVTGGVMWCTGDNLPVPVLLCLKVSGS